MAFQRTALVLAAALIVAFAFSIVQGQTPGYAPPRSRPPVQIVTYPNGQTGFFDPETRKLSIYGTDLKLLKNATFEQFGKPMTVHTVPKQ